MVHSFVLFSNKTYLTFNSKASCTGSHAMLVFSLEGIISSILRETFSNVEFSLSFIVGYFVDIRIVYHLSILHPFGLDRFGPSYLSNKLYRLTVKNSLQKQQQKNHNHLSCYVRKHMVNVLKFRTLYSMIFLLKFCFLCSYFLKQWNGKQCRPWSDCSFRSSLVWVCTVCTCHFVSHFGVWNFRTFTVPLEMCS